MIVWQLVARASALGVATGFASMLAAAATAAAAGAPLHNGFAVVARDATPQATPDATPGASPVASISGRPEVGTEGQRRR